MIWAFDMAAAGASRPIRAEDGWRVYLYARWTDGVFPWIRIGWEEFPSESKAWKHLADNSHLRIVSVDAEQKANDRDWDPDPAQPYIFTKANP